MSFEVDLAALGAAIPQVRGEAGGLDTELTALKGHFDSVEQAWKSPSGNGFAPLREAFELHAGDAVALLYEAAGRMQTSYNNYKATEEAIQHGYQQ